MTTPKMPSLVKAAVNRRAHQLALVQAIKIRENLMREAMEAMEGGASAVEVAARLGESVRAKAEEEQQRDS